MSKEFPEEKFIRASTEGSDTAVRMKNEIQIDLAKKWYGFDDVTFEQFDNWKEEYSKKFQTILDRMIKEDPHFWLHDKQTRSATLELFEDELYEKEGVVNPEVEEERFRDNRE